MRVKIEVVVCLVLVVLMTSFVSAGFFDFLNPSGRAADAPQNVSVTIAGANTPVVNFVENINGGSGVSPLEYTIKTVSFETHVYDQDGVGNINDSAVSARFTFGTTTRSGSCAPQADIDGFTANYTCSINMNYYDSSGSWTTNVSAKDVENNYADNTSEIFSYSILKSFAVPLSPSSLSFPTLVPGAANQNASNDPTIVNNTGNYNGNIFINSSDLVGQVISSEKLSANRFNVSGSSGSECTGIGLGPDSALTNTLISANPGPPGSNLANIYYCIPSVPFISSQTYSTIARGQSWIVTYN